MKSLLPFCLVLVSGQFCSGQSGWSTLNIPNAGRYDDVFFINDSVGWAAGGPSGWIRKTMDGGASWTLQFLAPEYLRSIEFINADTGFCGSLNTALYRTTDGGDSWTDISAVISPPPAGICGLSAPSSSTIYGCGLWASPAFVIKSSDGGDTWSYADMSAYAYALVDIHFITPDTGFVTGTAMPASNGGVILYTTDGGATWTPRYTTGTASDIVWKIQRLDADHWFASIFSEPVNDDTRMLSSIDGGATWIMSEVAGTYTYVETIGFLDLLHGWTGGSNTLWETTNGGTNWQQITLGDNYNRFFKVNDSTAYLSGSKIYKYTTDFSSGLTSEDHTREAHMLDVRPSITDGHVTIDVTLDAFTIADLRILGADGAILEVLMHGKKERGRYSFTTMLRTEADGVVFVVLKTNEGMQYRRAVLAR